MLSIHNRVLLLCLPVISNHVAVSKQVTARNEIRLWQCVTYQDHSRPKPVTSTRVQHFTAPVESLTQRVKSQWAFKEPGLDSQPRKAIKCFNFKFRPHVSDLTTHMGLLPRQAEELAPRQAEGLAPWLWTFLLLKSTCLQKQDDLRLFHYYYC